MGGASAGAGLRVREPVVLWVPVDGRPGRTALLAALGVSSRDMSYDQIEAPDAGSKITADGETLSVPDDPVVPILYGDGTGQDVSPAAQQVLTAAAEATGREVNWMRVYAGQSARERYGEDVNLPEETVEAIREHRVAIKGPLTTPVGAGYRSLNVALRQTLDLYANVRPTYYIEGVHSPMANPEEMDMVTFRENTEDVYAGIEWEAGTDEAEQVRAFVEEEMGFDDVMHEGDIGIGLKPISEKASKRLVREAIDYAIERDREKVTLVHKGNIMKFTEAAFSEWGMEVAEEEYPDEEVFAAPDSLWEEEGDVDIPEDAVVVDERLADNMLQQIQTRTDEYGVLAMPNLNGDYISDACGAQIGGLGIAPGANFGHGRCLAEPVHGSAPKYAGQDKVNPSAMILSGRIMYEYMGWDDAADLIYDAIEAQVQDKRVTYDIERSIEGGERVGTSTFAEEVAERIHELA
jgi:isocitrate dehydrogenase